MVQPLEEFDSNFPFNNNDMNLMECIDSVYSVYALSMGSKTIDGIFYPESRS